MNIIPRESQRCSDLSIKLKDEFNRKYVTYPWMVKVLALALDDDEEGNHISIELLECARKY